MVDIINLKTICAIQKKKLAIYSFLIVFSIFGFLIINLTIVASGLYIRDQFERKKNSVALHSAQVSNIETAIKNINNFKIDNNLKRKNGIYLSFNKQDFIDAVVKKMDIENDFDNIDSGENFEYSGLKMYFYPLGNSNIEKKIENIKKKVEVLEKQGIDIKYDGNFIRVSFYADYEYVIYRVWNIIKNIFPGYVVIRKFNVKPEREEVKTLLYERKFYEATGYMNVDNRLKCDIEFDWVMLSSNTMDKNSVIVD